MITIQKVTDKELDDIVKIHEAAFPDFFLTTLGSKFLHLYYKCMAHSKDALAMCAIQNGKVVGFSASSYVSHGFNKSLIKSHLFSFGLQTIRLLFSQPKSILRLLKNLDKKATGSSVEDDGSYAELYSIAVLPDCQGLGVGRQLLTQTEADVAKHNDRISLTTDYYNNDKTIAFYHSLGYRDYYEFVTYPERRMWRMMKDLNQ